MGKSLHDIHGGFSSKPSLSTRVDGIVNASCSRVFLIELQGVCAVAGLMKNWTDSMNRWWGPCQWKPSHNYLQLQLQLSNFNFSFGFLAHWGMDTPIWCEEKPWVLAVPYLANPYYWKDLGWGQDSNPGKHRDFGHFESENISVSGYPKFDLSKYIENPAEATHLLLKSSNKEIPCACWYIPYLLKFGPATHHLCHVYFHSSHGHKSWEIPKIESIFKQIQHFFLSM